MNEYQIQLYSCSTIMNLFLLAVPSVMSSACDAKEVLSL